VKIVTGRVYKKKKKRKVRAQPTEKHEEKGTSSRKETINKRMMV